MMKWNEIDETVIAMVKKLRAYADTVHSPTHARIAAVVTMTPPLSASVLDILELQYELESKAMKWYTTTDIANVFSSIPLAAEYRPQYTWNQLPQGWKHSSTICHGLIQAALEKGLRRWLGRLTSRSTPRRHRGILGESSVRARPLRLSDDCEEDGRVKVEVPEEEIAKLFVIKEVEPTPIPEEVEQAVVPWVWETGVPGKSKAAQPVIVELKEGAQPVNIKQYPIKLEAKEGVAPLIAQFLTQGILEECESEYNTPIFPVKKPNGKYRLVQDLRAINNIVKDIHPVVANPYTLLTSVSEKFKWFTVIDLKDAFFCIPLALQSRKYFAFEWESPDTGRKKQLTWTRIPQGFKNSPSIFGNQLAKELEGWQMTEVRDSPSSYVILQYVNDIFLATEEKELCLKLTIALLNMLGQAGYRVSKEKAQLVKESVIYLGCEIIQGQRRLGINRVEAICAIPLPRSHQELRSFLGMVGWCRLWIPNFGLLAKPLYEALKEPQLNWDRLRKNAFQNLKRALKEAPALGLPDLSKDFQLYVNERQKLALGVLTQRIGSWKRPVGYFSKQLDTVSAGWPSCLRVVAATVILIQEARKLTMGKKMEVFVPHMVLAVLEQKGGHWLSSSRMLQYQAILREQDDVELKITNHINPAEFLRSEQEEGELAHDCVEVIEQVYASRMDLKDTPMEDPDWELFTDGSSYVENGTRYAGYAVVTVHTVVEAKALPPGTSAQKAEIIGLTRALILSTGTKVNIWTDSKYAFGTKQVKPLLYGGWWSKYGEAWQIDYITLPRTRQGKRYVLTMVEASTGWLETSPVPYTTAWNTILGLENCW
ncbi:uncharacterized protein LOC132341411 [Haemorhous mexicanus]|uniref:uncharacterized protein LOC132341411 n=1 Tax=Haemorhous mexicanus TaxID=30427 RepID=UPI0028BEA5BA|nr:uncharacterized protein LOC132341411 [Haemorhous mexicanus]